MYQDAILSRSARELASLKDESPKYAHLLRNSCDLCERNNEVTSKGIGCVAIVGHGAPLRQQSDFVFGAVYTLG